MKNIRIQRRDVRNIVIEYEGKNKKGEPTWVLHGYYGKMEHLIPALINLCIETPQGDNLKEQLNDLSAQLEDIQALILSTLTVPN
jgi:hypothetical protein